MKKKILLILAGILMLAIVLVGGSNIPTLYKNYAQFVSFIGIAICVYFVMQSKNSGDNK